MSISKLHACLNALHYLCMMSREDDLREHIPMPHDSFFQSILSFAPRCESYFSSRPHGRAANNQRIRCHCEDFSRRRVDVHLLKS